MKLLLLALGLLCLPACAKHEPDCCASPPVEMTRIQTQCADAWGYGTTNAESITKLTNYLSQKNIKVVRIELQFTGEGITCYGCTCSRGYTFHVWVQSQYINALAAEGFSIK